MSLGFTLTGHRVRVYNLMAFLQNVRGAHGL